MSTYTKSKQTLVKSLFSGFVSPQHNMKVMKLLQKQSFHTFFKYRLSCQMQNKTDKERQDEKHGGMETAERKVWGNKKITSDELNDEGWKKRKEGSKPMGGRICSQEWEKETLLRVNCDSQLQATANPFSHTHTHTHIMPQYVSLSRYTGVKGQLKAWGQTWTQAAAQCKQITLTGQQWLNKLMCEFLFLLIAFYLLPIQNLFHLMCVKYNLSIKLNNWAVLDIT